MAQINSFHGGATYPGSSVTKDDIRKLRLTQGNAVLGEFNPIGGSDQTIDIPESPTSGNSVVYLQWGTGSEALWNSIVSALSNGKYPVLSNGGSSASFSPIIYASRYQYIFASAREDGVHLFTITNNQGTYTKDTKTVSYGDNESQFVYFTIGAGAEYLQIYTALRDGKFPVGKQEKDGKTYWFYLSDVRAEEDGPAYRFTSVDSVGKKIYCIDVYKLNPDDQHIEYSEIPLGGGSSGADAFWAVATGTADATTDYKLVVQRCSEGVSATTLPKGNYQLHGVIHKTIGSESTDSGLFTVQILHSGVIVWTANGVVPAGLPVGATWDSDMAVILEVTKDRSLSDFQCKLLKPDGTDLDDATVEIQVHNVDYVGESSDPVQDSELSIIISPPLDTVSGQVSAASGAQDNKPSMIGHAFAVGDYFHFTDGDVFGYCNVNTNQNCHVLIFAVYRWDKDNNRLRLVAISDNAANAVRSGEAGYKTVGVNFVATGYYQYIDPKAIHYMVTFCDADSLKLAGLEAVGSSFSMHRPYAMFKKQALSNATDPEYIKENYQQIDIENFNMEDWQERICVALYHN